MGLNTYKKKHINLYIANPRGFCAGVDRAIKMVEQALKYMADQFTYGMKLSIIDTLLKN